MGRIHPITGTVAFDAQGCARSVAWYGEACLYQRLAADGAWELVTRAAAPNSPEVTVLPRRAALAVRAGRWAWHSRLDVGGVPTLASSLDVLNGVVGFEGAVAAVADVTVTLNLNKDVVTVWHRTGKGRTIALPGGVAGEPWVDQVGQWFVAQCFAPAGETHLTLVNLDTGVLTTPQCLTPQNQWNPTCVTVAGTCYLVYGTDECGVVVHPALDASKWMRLAAAPAFGLDVCLLPGGDTLVVWFTGAREAADELRSLRLRAVDLLNLPITPKGTTPMPKVFPPDALYMLERFALKFPAPWGPPGESQDAQCRAWTARLAAQVAFSLGSQWGHKSTSPGGPLSKDVIARRNLDGTLDGWDVLSAAGGGQPTIPDPPSWVDLSGQTFRASTPAHALGEQFTTTRPAPPSPWRGLTSFDLGVRLEQGDTRWLDLCKAEGVTTPRVILGRKATAATLAIAFGRLPTTLAKLAQYGFKAEIVLCADTAEYGMTEKDVLAWATDCMAQIDAQPDGVGAIQGANEPEHPTQQPFMREASFQSRLAATVARKWPYTPGASTHGGDGGTGASYLTTHGRRDRSVAVNADVSATLSRDTGLWVVEDEPLGVAEVAQSGRRTSDPGFGAQLADACRSRGLGATLHLEAGLTCDVALLGPVQLAALRGFMARMRTGFPPPPPPPVPAPGDALLDLEMAEDAVWYPIFVLRQAELRAAAAAWYFRATGRPAADADINHGLLWRASCERLRWRTLRRAFEDTWPGGAPGA